MKRFTAALAATAALGFARFADAAITATSIGTANSVSSAVGSLSATGLSPTAGQFTAVVWNTNSAPTGFTCGDDVAGTTGWTVIPRYITASAGAGYMWACWNPSISAGVTSITITVTAGTNGAMRMAIAQFTGMAASPRDATGDSPGNSSNTAAGTGSDTTGGLAQSDELLIGFQSDGSGTNSTGFTPGTGWTALTGVGAVSGNLQIRWAWSETASASAVTWSPSWSPNGKWGIKIYAFKAASASTPVCTLLTTGIGSC